MRGRLWLLVGLLAVVIAVAFLMDKSENAPTTAADSYVPGTEPITEMPYGVYRVPPQRYMEVALRLGVAPGLRVLLPEDSGDAANESTPAAAELVDRRSDAVGYLGSQACAECHREQFEGFRRTIHHLTSRPAGREPVLGPLEPPRNTLRTGHPDLRFRVEQAEGRFFQEVLVEHDGRTYSFKQEIDLVVGSGKRGQSYLYWLGDHLYQAHLSYFKETDAWINSPGPAYFTDGTANFARPVQPRCVDCHTTWFEHEPGTQNRYRRSSYLLGVGCERCHGPGRRHVEAHRRQPEATAAMHIVNPGRLPQDRAINVCTQCHGAPRQPPFTFRPGEVLDEFPRPEPGQPLPSGGVHSDDQFASLRVSRCFQQSQGMTCATCHNLHQHEGGRLEVFSERCVRCHQPDHAGPVASLGAALQRNCIDCHMPKRRVGAVPMQTTSGVQMPLGRNHLIAIWPDVSRQVLERMRTSMAAEPPQATPPAVDSR